MHEGLWVTDDNHYHYGRLMGKRMCYRRMDRPFYVFEERKQNEIGVNGIPGMFFLQYLYFKKSFFAY